jgi:toxin ParE1/3/4
MGYEIQFRKSALNEIEKALDYYLTISPSVGFSFDEDMEYAILILKQNPHFEIKFNNYRVLPLSKFPYIVIYTILEDIKIVDIVSIFHTSQNPKKYPK